jgi:anaerobic magnesium-protoporphyrin IX monomethyl ester cyclase
VSDLVIIHPGASQEIYQGLSNEFSAIEQPLWTRLIAGYVRQNGFSVSIIDADADRLSPAFAAERTKKESPRLVAIAVEGQQPSASSQKMVCAGQIAREIKKLSPDQRIIMTGNHPSALPERTLREEEINYVADGEGALTIVGLLRGTPLNNIPGLVWRISPHSMIWANAAAPLLDLDNDLHGDAWDLFPMDRYRSHNWQRLDDQKKRKPYAAIYTSLGCPYACHFCMINVFQHTNRYRTRSPESVVKEMVMLNREYGVETFKFTDELFILKKAHYEAICNGIIAAGLGDKISSWCYARTDTVNPGSLDLLRRAGFNWFALGIESGSKVVRDGANKALRNDDIVGVVRSIENAGINVISNFIFGLSNDTHATMKETLDLALELNTAWANFYVAQAYPGSPLYDEAVSKGWTLPESWIGYSQHSYETRCLDTEHLTAAEVLQFRDDAFQQYFTNPAYLVMLRHRFGLEIVQHVMEMTSHKIKRKLLEAA